MVAVRDNEMVGDPPGSAHFGWRVSALKVCTSRTDNTGDASDCAEQRCDGAEDLGLDRRIVDQAVGSYRVAMHRDAHACGVDHLDAGVGQHRGQRFVRLGRSARRGDVDPRCGLVGGLEPANGPIEQGFSVSRAWRRRIRVSRTRSRRRRLCDRADRRRRVATGRDRRPG